MSRPLYLLTDPAAFPGAYMPPQKVDDLVSLSSAPLDQLQAVADRTAAVADFLPPSRLRELVAEVISDETLSGAVARAVQSIRPGRADATVAELTAWRAASPRNAERVPEEVVDRIRERLGVLIREAPALARYDKAERLAGLTGRRLDTADLVCDLRPVFDKDRKTVDGLLPVITLRLGFTEQSGNEGVAEFVLDGWLMDRLTKLLDQARQKLDVMQGLSSEVRPGGWVVVE